MPAAKGAIEFSGGDEMYQDWLEANPDGYVLNLRRDKNPVYMVLHKATCKRISKYNQTSRPGGFTQRSYIKVCSTGLNTLREWIRDNGRPNGSFSNECSSCKPT